MAARKCTSRVKSRSKNLLNLMTCGRDRSKPSASRDYDLGVLLLIVHQGIEQVARYVVLD